MRLRSLRFSFIYIIMRIEQSQLALFSARILDHIVQKPCTFRYLAAARGRKYAWKSRPYSIKKRLKSRLCGMARPLPREQNRFAVGSADRISYFDLQNKSCLKIIMNCRVFAFTMREKQYILVYIQGGRILWKFLQP